jgi:hypothetical protein
MPYWLLWLLDYFSASDPAQILIIETDIDQIGTSAEDFNETFFLIQVRGFHELLLDVGDIAPVLALAVLVPIRERSVEGRH